MSSPAVVKAGLLQMGQAWGRVIDRPMESVWLKACRELSDAQFEYGVDQVMQHERFFPPPAVVIAAGFGMKRDASDRPALPIRRDESFWAYPEQQAELLEVVRKNPITETERNGRNAGAMCYIRRIAIAAGLISDEDAPRSIPTRTGDQELPTGDRSDATAPPPARATDSGMEQRASERRSLATGPARATGGDFRAPRWPDEHQTDNSPRLFPERQPGEDG